MSKEPVKGERIAKRLSRAGISSRREAERLIAGGRVEVNGEVITSPVLNVTPADKVLVDGRLLLPPGPPRIWLFHKPAGYVTTAADELGRETIYDVLPADLPRVMPIGRLDLTSEGLLLLTNDGGIKRRIELPATGWLRKYRVRVNGTPDEAMLAPLRKGVVIDGEEFQPMGVELDRQQGANAWLTVSLREGRNREIRRAMESVGLTVNRLIRTSYGPFRLGELAAGAVEEVKARIVRDQLGLDEDGKPAAGFAARPGAGAGTDPDAEKRPRKPRNPAASGRRPAPDAGPYSSGPYSSGSRSSGPRSSGADGARPGKGGAPRDIRAGFSRDDSARPERSSGSRPWRSDESRPSRGGGDDTRQARSGDGARPARGGYAARPAREGDGPRKREDSRPPREDSDSRQPRFPRGARGDEAGRAGSRAPRPYGPGPREKAEGYGNKRPAGGARPRAESGTGEARSFRPDRAGSAERAGSGERAGKTGERPRRSYDPAAGDRVRPERTGTDGFKSRGPKSYGSKSHGAGPERARSEGSGGERSYGDRPRRDGGASSGGKAEGFRSGGFKSGGFRSGGSGSAGAAPGDPKSSSPRGERAGFRGSRGDSGPRGFGGEDRGGAGKGARSGGPKDGKSFGKGAPRSGGSEGGTRSDRPAGAPRQDRGYGERNSGERSYAERNSGERNSGERSGGERRSFTPRQPGAGGKPSTKPRGPRKPSGPGKG